MCKTIKTPEEVKAEFERKGLSASAWARSNGFSRQLVSAILRGERVCRIGESHKIAVMLGIKTGEIVDGSSHL